MIFRKKRSLIKGYLHYWLNALNEHSLHAPFVYRLYGEVIKPDRHEPQFERIESLRRALLRCDDQILIENLGAPSYVSSRSKRTVRSVARHSLSSPNFSRLLYRLVQDQSAYFTIELGTSLGVNTHYLSVANPSGQVFTLEGTNALADQAERSFRREQRTNIKLVRGNIDDTLPELLRQIPQVDLAYLDANHRYEPTVRYFEQLVAKTHHGSILVIDDIYWSDEMQQAWQTIQQHPSVTLSIDLFSVGLVLFQPLSVRQHYTLIF